MKISLTQAKNIIVRSKLPDADYVVNPYTGCQHGCIYCYAEFMKRFTNHGGENWGSFVDVKQYKFSNIQPAKYNGKRILFSSVTDPYQPIEKKYQNTRRILENLLGTTASISILTKSPLVTRDIDLFKQFTNIQVGISLSTLDPVLAQKLEPKVAAPEYRLEALKAIYKEDIETYLFISPFFPEITNYKKIIECTKGFIDLYMVENINFRPHNKKRILNIISEYDSFLMGLYVDLISSSHKWDPIEKEIRDYFDKKAVPCDIYFHHGGFK